LQSTLVYITHNTGIAILTFLVQRPIRFETWGPHSSECEDSFFWNVMLCSLEYMYHCFGGTCCLHLQGLPWKRWCISTKLCTFMSYPRKDESSWLLLWEPQISYQSKKDWGCIEGQRWSDTILIKKCVSVTSVSIILSNPCKSYCWSD
jgi:hypothetical protein